MALCGGCGQRSNPKEAPVVGPAVVLGNGALRPFDSDEALDRYVAKMAVRRPGERFTIVREGATLP